MRELVFLEYANKGLEKLIKSYRSRHLSKKGDRFSINGVAYQIGPIKVKGAGALELEISSKIPLDKFSIDDYVELLEQEFLSLVDGPVEIKPIKRKRRELRGRTFIRAYFVITTTLSDEDLYDNEEINRQAERAMLGKLNVDLSGYYAWPSLPGKLVLRSVELSTRKEAKKLVDALIEANKRAKAYSK